MAVLALLLSWLVALPGAAHPNSQSSSRIVVEGRSVEVELVCQTLSLIECVEIDADGDLELDEAELGAGRAEAERYLSSRYRLSALDGRAVELAGGSLELLEAPSELSEQRMRVRWRGELPADAEGLIVDVRLFVERNPLHRDFATVAWNGEEPFPWMFSAGAETLTFEPSAKRRPRVLGGAIALGVEHILIGYDHLAFLVALIVASRRVRSLVAVVTAFTVAHSLTLGLAALGIVSVPSTVVELAIALSIAYVGAENLLFRRPAARWPEGFLFGLIHGLGFASVLEETLMYEQLRLTVLVGFNLGVELGQLAVVTLAALALRWMPGDRAFEGEPRAWFAPRWLRTSASAVVTLLGLAWFAERAGWLSWGAA
jgi:hydrogenase/urease accessory protein HupE